jgi:hypothetical protein
MLGLNKESIPIVLLKDIEDVDIENAQTAMDWDQFSDFMQIVKVTEDKRDVEALIPCKMIPKPWTPTKKNNYRHDGTFGEITIGGWDLDTPGGLEAMRRVLADFDYIVHSTHSYTKDTPYKFRVYVRLAVPIPAEDWPETYHKIAAPIKADPSCSNASRGYYRPSHNPNAGIDHFFDRNIGRSLTLEDAGRIAAEHMSDLKKNKDNKATKKFSAKIGALPKAEGKMHFASGDLVNQNQASRVVDFSYEGYRSRHSDFIEDLKTHDSRHDFAKEVVWRELISSKENIDIKSLVLFLHRAAIDDSSKPLFGVKGKKAGNTEGELFELIESAYNKISRRNPINRDLHSILGQFDSILDQAKSEAVVYYRTRNESAMNFPGKIDNRRSKKKSEADSYADEMEDRHVSAISNYRSATDRSGKASTNWSRFVHSVMNEENALSDSVKTYHCVNFILKITDEINKPINGDEFRKAAFKVADLLVDRDERCQKMLMGMGENERKEKEKELKKKLKFTFSSGMAKMKSLHPPVTSGIASP